PRRAVPAPSPIFSGPEEDPVDRIVSLFAVGEVQYVEVIDELGGVGRRHVDAREYSPVIRSMVTVVKQRDVPARTDGLQEVQQRAFTFREFESIQSLIGDVAVDVSAD